MLSQKKRQNWHATWPLLILFGLAACSAEESTDQAQTTYARNVESCTCRILAYEADSYSGITYDDMVKQCNTTVREANPTRYEDAKKLHFKMDEIRCPEDVEDWQETVAEARIHQAASRKRYQEFTDSEQTN